MGKGFPQETGEEVKILHCRQGFPTNSSSMHSIIKAGTSKGCHPYSHKEDMYFGDKWWLCDTPKKKLEYMQNVLYTLLYYKMTRGLDWTAGQSKEVQKLAQNVLKTRKHLGEVDRAWDSFLAVNPDNSPNFEFYLDLIKAISKDPSIEIRGGSDHPRGPNIDLGEPHVLEGIFKPWGADCYLATKMGPVWRLYNRHNGNKIHLLLGDTCEMDTGDWRPPAPELVDLKITDYCDKKCPFCYQNSTTKGLAAPTENVIKFLKSCGKAGVLEVAIGGGDPTTHPDFVEILRVASQNVYSVAFSVKGTEWLNRPGVWEATKNYARAVGWSVSSPEEVREDNLCIMEKFHEGEFTAPYWERTPHITWHVIPDLPGATYQGLREIIDEGGYGQTLLLLGYKETGRAKGKPTEVGAKILAHFLAEENGYMSVGVDTAFARKYKEILDKRVNPMTFFTQEGRFSMYYDAVTDRCGPSSYEEGQNACGLSVQEMFDRVRVTG